jgi:hypothetical protein
VPERASLQTCCWALPAGNLPATAPDRVAIVRARDALLVLGDRRSSSAAKSFALRIELVRSGILER